VTVPVLSAIAPGIEAVLGGGIGNPEVAPGVEISRRVEKTIAIGGEGEEEAIFAVAYDVIRGSRSLALDSKSFLKRTIRNAGPKMAKDRHLAFAPGEDGSDEDEDDEEIVYVDTSRLGDVQFDEQGFDGASFELPEGSI